jgi:hypothetical protein
MSNSQWYFAMESKWTLEYICNSVDLKKKKRKNKNYKTI